MSRTGRSACRWAPVRAGYEMESIPSTLPHSEEIRGLRPLGSVSPSISIQKTLYNDTIYNDTIISSAVCPPGHAAGGCEYLADSGENGKRHCEPEASLKSCTALLRKRTRGFEKTALP